MTTQIRVSGLQATSGQRYVSIETDIAFATLRLEQFSLANPRLAADLAEAGLLITSKKRQDELVGEVGHIQHFEENRIAEFPGWNGKLFAMHDGKVIGTDAPSVLAYRPQPDLVQERGTLAGWQRKVVRPLFDQPVLALTLMAAFLPPVLRLMPQAGNLTIELVGPSNTGKSAAQSVAASAYGPAHYIQILRKVLRDPDAARRGFRDHLAIIDHLQPVMITATKNRKADIYATMAFDLLQAPGGRVTLLSGREPLASVCNMEAEGSTLTLRMRDDELGILSGIPEGFESGAAFISGLVAATRAHHGLAFPAFMEKLHGKLTRDQSKVRGWLAKYRERFLRSANVTPDQVTEYRAALHFASIYAAGRLARRYRVLPSDFPTLRLALSAFDQYRSAQADQQPFTARLEALIGNGKLVMLSPDSDPVLQAEAVDAAIGTVAIRATARIVKIAPDNIAKAFPDWQRIKGSPEVRSVLKVDGKNLAVWGHLAPGKERIRLFQFELPLQAEPTLFTGSQAGGPEDSRSW